MVIFQRHSLFLFILLGVFFVSCKKDLLVLDYHENASISNIELVKNWYNKQKGLLKNEGGKNRFSLKSIKTNNNPKWEKTIWSKKSSSYITPITIDKKNLKGEIDVEKYLITKINTANEIQEESYLFVINKNIQQQTERSLTNCINYLENSPLQESNSILFITYDLDYNLIISKSVESKIDKINVKIHIDQKNIEEINEISPSYADPNEEGCSFITIDWYWQTYENGVLVAEEYVYSTNELVCTGGGGGEGSGGGNIDPCSGADSLANNAEFKLKLDSLKMKTSINKEFGYYYKNGTSNTINETSIEGNFGELGIEFDKPLEPIDGFMHSHFNLPGRSLSIFSPGDLLTMASLYASDKMANPLTFTAAVVTADGTQYLLKIEDLGRFSHFVENIATSLKAIEGEYNFSNIKNGNSINQNELGFTRFLRFVNSGLKLFKGNSNFSNWQPIKYAPGGIINSPCN